MQVFRDGLWSKKGSYLGTPFKSAALVAQHINQMCFKRYDQKGLAREIRAGKWSVMALNCRYPTLPPMQVTFERTDRGFVCRTRFNPTTAL